SGFSRNGSSGGWSADCGRGGPRRRRKPRPSPRTSTSRAGAPAPARSPPPRPWRPCRASTSRSFCTERTASSACGRGRAGVWRVVFTPAATVRHRLGRSMARSEGRAELEYHRSHLLYYRKHNGLLATGLLRLLLAARGAALWAARRPQGSALLKLGFRGR